MASIISAGTTSGTSLNLSGDTSGVLQLATNGSTTALTITTGQLVGIGTSSPNTPLSLVANHVSSQGILKIQTITAFASGGLSSIALNDSDGTRKGFIYQDSNAIYMETNGAFPVIFQPNGAERMRISSNGVVGVGQDATSFGQFVVKFDATGTANNSLGIGIAPVANTSNANFLQFYNATGNSCGNVTRNGTSNAVLYNTSSDYRLKENINPMTGALAKVQLLKPVTWTWIEGKQSGEGFIAHELQEVIPSAVTGQKDEMQTYVDSEGVEKTRPKYQGLDASYIVATLTAAIQEQQAMIETLQAEVAALKGVK